MGETTSIRLLSLWCERGSREEEIGALADGEGNHQVLGQGSFTELSNEACGSWPDLARRFPKARWINERTDLDLSETTLPAKPCSCGWTELL